MQNAELRKIFASARDPTALRSPFASLGFRLRFAPLKMTPRERKSNLIKIKTDTVGRGLAPAEINGQDNLHFYNRGERPN